jgi:hypothetical protein
MHEKDGKWIHNIRKQGFHKTLNPTRMGEMDSQNKNTRIP